jgi:repressor LexA
MIDLTTRQQEVLDFIRRFTRGQGYPPTMREIAANFGFSSTNAAAAHVKALERKGAIRRSSKQSRSIVVCEEPIPTPSNLVNFHLPEEPVRIPVLGRVAAGVPLLAEEHIEETLLVDPFFTNGRRSDVFSLIIDGDSMIDAGIHDGDYVFVRVQKTARNGEIIIALIDDETTCKFYHPEAGSVRLQPANSAMAPILFYPDEGRQFTILGVVIGVFRKV